MNKEQAAMFNMAMQAFLRELPPRHQENTPRIDGKTMMAVVERAPTGQKHENGKLYREVGRITIAQAQIIAQTSGSVEEMTHRLKLLLLEGNDTTKFRSEPVAAGNMVPMDQVQEIVKLALIEAEKQRQGTMPTASVEKVVERIVDPPKPVDQKVGIQAKKKLSVKEYQKINQAQLDLYKERAEILGEGPPILRKSNGKVDGRYMRKIDKLWAAHLSSETVA